LKSKWFVETTNYFDYFTVIILQSACRVMKYSVIGLIDGGERRNGLKYEALSLREEENPSYRF